MKGLLLDTSAVYALVNARDKNHARAGQFLADWFKGSGVVLVTDSVFSELVTLIKVRMGVSKAVEAGRTLRNAPLYHWTPLSLEDEANAWMLFQKYTDKEWSFVDCGLFVVARRLSIPVFAFDHHFEQMPEVERVP